MTDRPKLRRLTAGEDDLDTMWEVIMPWDAIGCVSAPRQGTHDGQREWTAWSYRPDPDAAPDPVDELADEHELAKLGASPAEMEGALPDYLKDGAMRQANARFLKRGFVTRREAVMYVVAHALGIT